MMAHDEMMIQGGSLEAPDIDEIKKHWIQCAPENDCKVCEHMVDALAAWWSGEYY